MLPITPLPTTKISMSSNRTFSPKTLYSSRYLVHKPSFWRHRSGKSYSVAQREVQKPTASSQIPCDISETQTSTVCFCGEPMTSCGRSCGHVRNSIRKRTRERNGRRRRANGRSHLELDYGLLIWRDPRTF